MAKENHLKILKQGVDIWNEWRWDNAEIINGFSTGKYKIIPDVSGADLSNMNLNGISFHGAILKHANLSGSYLARADCIEADFTKAILNDTKLIDTEFYGAKIIEAKLKRANLLRTNFVFADLSGSDFYLAELMTTFFVSTNLSNTRNLDTCIHRRPSIIDHNTIGKSGRLSPIFLRGCGMPEALIELLPSLLDKPSQFYSCFISYSHGNEQFAKQLYEDLQDSGVRCWFAPEDIKIGDKIRSVIDESIRLYDKLLLILSENSIKSSWVEKEVEAALEKEHIQNKTILFPIKIDNSVMETNQAWAADIRRTRNIGDFANWKNPSLYKKALDRLIHDLKALK